MEGLKPGRIVYFVFGSADAQMVDDQRDRAGGFVGNSVYTGLVAPAMVVAIIGEQGICNLKVMLDGHDTYWATSVEFHGDKRPRSWHWMFEGQQKRYAPDRVETAS